MIFTTVLGAGHALSVPVVIGSSATPDAALPSMHVRDSRVVILCPCTYRDG